MSVVPVKDLGNEPDPLWIDMVKKDIAKQLKQYTDSMTDYERKALSMRGFAFRCSHGDLVCENVDFQYCVSLALGDPLGSIEVWTGEYWKTIWEGHYEQYPCNCTHS